MRKKYLLTYSCGAYRCNKQADIRYSWRRENGDKMYMLRCLKHPLGKMYNNDGKKEILNLENRDGYDVKGWRKCLRCFEGKKYPELCQEYKCLNCSEKGETCIVG